MSRKTIVQIAVVMVIVFTLIVVAYPMLFGPNQSQIEQPVAPSLNP